MGKFSEFDQLRKVGVRFADVRGYQYSREDVRGQALANAYSQAIGEVFTREMKPLEIELIVAEVGDDRYAEHGANALLFFAVSGVLLATIAVLVDQRALYLFGFGAEGSAGLFMAVLMGARASASRSRSGCRGSSTGSPRRP